MVLATIFALAVFAVILYFSIRILGNLFKGLLIVGILFLASFIIIGSFPNLRNIPVVGDWIPEYVEFPANTGDFIQILRGFFYELDIETHDRTSTGNLLVVVENEGRLKLKGFYAMVNGQNATIINTPKEPLLPGESTTIEIDWKEVFENITIKTREASSFYSLS